MLPLQQKQVADIGESVTAAAASRKILLLYGNRRVGQLRRRVLLLLGYCP